MAGPQLAALFALRSPRRLTELAGRTGLRQYSLCDPRRGMYAGRQKKVKPARGLPHASMLTVRGRCNIRRTWPFDERALAEPTVEDE